MGSKDYNRIQQGIYKKLKKMMHSGGGLENMLMCLMDIISDMIKESDAAVAAGIGVESDADIEYLRVLHRNLSKTYEDYCNRYGSEDLG